MLCTGDKGAALYANLILQIIVVIAEDRDLDGAAR